MVSNQDLYDLMKDMKDDVRKDLKSHGKILENLKDDMKNVKEEMRDVKKKVKSHSVKGNKQEKKIAALEAQVQELITSDQDHRRRNGRRCIILI